MSKSELLVTEQVERADFSSADICSAKPPAVPEAVKRHRKPPEGRVLQGFHEPPPKSVTVRKCRFSPPHRQAARHSRLPFSGGPGWSAWRKSPDIQALPEGATTVTDRGFNAAGSQRTIRCSTVGRHHDWHRAKRCAVGSSLPNPKRSLSEKAKRCAVGFAVSHLDLRR